MFVPLMTAVLLSAPICSQGPPKPAKRSAVPEVGKPAPSFRLNDDKGRAVRVGGRAKTWTVVAFYPKAATPG